MNFDSFVPDLIVGVFTGVVVGVALFLIERYWRAHESEEQASQEWGPRLERLEELLDRPFRFDETDLLLTGAEGEHIREELKSLPSVPRGLLLDLREMNFLTVIYDSFPSLSARATAVRRELNDVLGGPSKFFQGPVLNAVALSDEDELDRIALTAPQLTDDLLQRLYAHDALLASIHAYLEIQNRMQSVRQAFIEYRESVRSRLWNEDPTLTRYARRRPRWVWRKIELLHFKRWSEQVREAEFRRLNQFE